jgi:hypothetical protein
MSEQAYRLLHLTRALARSDAELFGQRLRSVEAARCLPRVDR